MTYGKANIYNTIGAYQSMTDLSCIAMAIRI